MEAFMEGYHNARSHPQFQAVLVGPEADRYLSDKATARRPARLQDAEGLRRGLPRHHALDVRRHGRRHDPPLRYSRWPKT